MSGGSAGWKAWSDDLHSGNVLQRVTDPSEHVTSWGLNGNQKALSLRIDQAEGCVGDPIANPEDGTTLADMYVRNGGNTFNTIAIANNGTGPMDLTIGEFTGPHASVFSVLDAEPGPLAHDYPYPKQISGGGLRLLYIACRGGATEGLRTATFTQHYNIGLNSFSFSWPVECVVDNTPPTVEGNFPDPANGVWHRAPVQGSIRGVDPGSGDRIINLSCTNNGGEFVNVSAGAAFVTVSGEGQRDISCSAIDLARNHSTTPYSRSFNIDTRAPVITPEVDPAPNAAGWNNTTPVAVTFTCADPTPGSGINVDNAGNGSITSETAGTDVTSGGCSDVAGWESTATVTVRVDTTRPTVSATLDPPPDATTGWNRGGAVNFTNCMDTGAVQSGVESATPAPMALMSDTPPEGTLLTASACTDRAGNNAPISLRVFNDETAPAASITSSPTGTTRETSARLEFTVTDQSSGLASRECSLDDAAFEACTSPVDLTDLALGNHVFRVRGTDVAGNVGQPATSTWIVSDPLVVTTDPVDTTITPGETATFTAAATGTPAPTLRWQWNRFGSWQDVPTDQYPTATSTTLSVPTLDRDLSLDNVLFRAVFTNSSESVESGQAKLSLYHPPSITGHPGDARVGSGQVVTFTAAATSELAQTVRWQRSSNNGSSWSDIDQVAVPSAATTTLTFRTRPPDSFKHYRAVFTNAAGEAPTNMAHLNVVANNWIELSTSPVPVFVDDPVTATFALHNDSSNSFFSPQVRFFWPDSVEPDPTPPEGCFNLTDDYGDDIGVSCQGNVGTSEPWTVTFHGTARTVSEDPATISFTPFDTDEFPADDSATVPIRITESATITLTQQLVPSDDAGRFDLMVGRTAVETGAGHQDGGSTRVVAPDTYTLRERPAAETTAALYTYFFECTLNGGAGPSGNSRTLTVTVAADDELACDVTATRTVATVTVTEATIPASDPGTFTISHGAFVVATGAGDGGGGSIEVPPGTRSLRQLPAAGTKLSDYTVSISCKLNDAAGPSAEGTSVKVTLAAGDDLDCTFTSSRKATVTVTQASVPADDAGRFDLKVNGRTVAALASDGGSGSTVVRSGPVTISASPSAPTVRSNYTQAITCSLNGAPGPSSTTGKLTTTLTDADALACTVTATRKATVTVTEDLVPSTDPGRFVLRVGARIVRSDAGDGATGSALVAPGEVTISVAGYRTNLAKYNITIGCTMNGDATTLTITNGASQTRNVGAADVLECTVTTTRKT